MAAPLTVVEDFESVTRLLLDLAEQRSLDDVLRMIVQRLVAERPGVALARIWLKAPGDICATCPMAQECPDRTTCLHLVASAGAPQVAPDADWTRLDGDFRRIPIGVRKIGRVAQTAEAVTIRDLRADPQWVARPDWVAAESIRGFCGQPLVYRGELMGVMGVFTRSPIPAERASTQRLIADHAAAAIANARAFGEIQQLRRQLELENEYLREEVLDSRQYGDIVGHSEALQNIVRQIDLVAPTDANVLILGESGTGKELVAREIHKRSARAAGPMIRVNCASIPRELYESEFFGHVKGAFTGAVRDRTGRFELADRGTLFLDEVGEIPLDLQSKLLRVLQEGQYERVGDDVTRKVDVRVVAATNRDLKAEVESGRFREDLYYRLNVFPIEVPPLRRRKEDIPPLADHYVECLARRLNRPRPRLTQANILELQRYAWPGNVRELQNVLERALITSVGGKLRLELPDGAGAPEEPSPQGRNAPGTDVLTDAEMKQRERDNLLAAMQQTGGKISGPGGAADLLGLKPTTLASRLKKLGIAKPSMPQGPHVGASGR